MYYTQRNEQLTTAPALYGSTVNTITATTEELYPSQFTKYNLLLYMLLKCPPATAPSAPHCNFFHNFSITKTFFHKSCKCQVSSTFAGGVFVIPASSAIKIGKQAQIISTCNDAFSKASQIAF